MTNQPTDSDETPATSAAPAVKNPAGRSRSVCCLAVIVFVTTVVFGQVAWFDFLTWDDDVHVTDNQLLNPVSAAGLRKIWSAPYEGLYVPLSYSLFAAEAALPQDLLGENTTTSGSSLNPRLFHVGNVILHVICGVLVFLILLQLIGDELAACCGALVFCLHPVQVETVAWISELRGLLAACLSLLSIHSYLKFASSAETKPPSDKVTTPRHRRRNYVMSTLFFAMALLAKPTAVAVPLILAIIDTKLLGRHWKQSAKALSGWVILAVIFAVVTKSEQSTATMAFIPPVWARPCIAGDALAFYLIKLTVPIGLTFDHGRTPAWVMESLWFYLGWTIPVAVFVIVRFRFRQAVTEAALLMFVVGLLPVLGFVAFAFQDISTVADRYLYLSMLGAALAVAAIVSRVRHSAVIPTTVVWLLILATLSFRQLSFWQDNSALYARGLEINPRSFVACNNLGNQFLKKNQLRQAAEMFDRAIAIKPSNATAHYNLGLALARSGQANSAITQFQQAISIQQLRGLAVKAEMYFDLAASLERIGSLNEAETQYRNALEVVPQMTGARLGLGNVYHAKGEIDSAATQFRMVLKTEPDSVTAKIRLADMLLLQKTYPEAIGLYTSALEEHPEDAPRISLNLGIVFALQGQIDKAVDCLSEAHDALETTADSDLKSQLARAWFDVSEQVFSQGNVAQAIECLQKAARLVPVNSDPALAIQKRLQEFTTPDQSTGQ
jgi:protein O-mannosyl-transferase